MRTFTRFLATALLLTAGATALAATEMVMLKDGTTGMAEIVSTAEDSITVRFETPEGTAGETTLRASRLDEHSFYSVRSKHMEQTVENHVKLAIWAAENGLFKRAKHQMDQARKLDPEIDSKIEARPEIMQGIADRLAAAAKRAYEKGDLEHAYELAQLVATRFKETTWGDKAVEALDKLEAEMAQIEAEESAARERKIEEAADEEARAAADARHRALVPIEKRQDAGRRKNSQGLRANNRSTAKRHFEAAAADFQAALRSVESTRRSAGDDQELLALLDDLEGEMRSDGVNAWINAGNIDLWRDHFNGARDAGEKALAIDPNSSAAKSFMNKVHIARAASGSDWDSGGRPTPRPPRPTPR
jgi:hypothetical protein